MAANLEYANPEKLRTAGWYIIVVWECEIPRYAEAQLSAERFWGHHETRLSRDYREVTPIEEGEE
jgi:G:T-mismatch repair DNA endonuclease (very short patch repair protein)